MHTGIVDNSLMVSYGTTDGSKDPGDKEKSRMLPLSPVTAHCGDVSFPDTFPARGPQNWPEHGSSKS